MFNRLLQSTFRVWASIKYICSYIYVYVYNCFDKFIKAVLSEASSSTALKAAFKATLSEVSMKAAFMIVLYDVASPDVVGHIILDHVSLIFHYSEMHHHKFILIYICTFIFI